MDSPTTCAHAIGYIRTKEYYVFEQCYSFCLKKKIDYYSCHHSFNNSYSDKDSTLFFVYLFTWKCAVKVLTFLNRLELDYIFVNVIEDWYS